MAPAAHSTCPWAHSSELALLESCRGVSRFSGAAVSCKRAISSPPPLLGAWSSVFSCSRPVEAPNSQSTSLPRRGWGTGHSGTRSEESFSSLDPVSQVQGSRKLPVSPIPETSFSSHFPSERFPLWAFHTKNTAPLGSKDSACSPPPCRGHRGLPEPTGGGGCPSAPSRLICGQGKLPRLGLLRSLPSLGTVRTILPPTPLLLAVRPPISPRHCGWPPGPSVGAGVTHPWHMPPLPQDTLRRLAGHSEQGGLPFHHPVFLCILSFKPVMEHPPCSHSELCRTGSRTDRQLWEFPTGVWSTSEI